MEELNNYMLWIKKHKILFLILVVIVLVIGGISYLFIGSMYTGFRSASEYAVGYAPLKAPYMSTYEQTLEERTSEIISKPSEYLLKRGSASMKSNNAMMDYERIKQRTESLSGWVETMSKNENYREISIRADLKIPSEEFDTFADWLINNFDIQNANLEFYRVSIERQQDEIQILQLSLNLYDRLLERVEKMNVTTESIELIMRITERKLDVMRLLKSYGYSVEKVEEKAKYATLTLTITQQKKIQLIPEDMGTEFRSRMRKMVTDIVNAGMDLATIPLAIFVKIIVYIIYAIIILIPIFIAIKFLLRIFRIISKKI